MTYDEHFRMQLETASFADKRRAEAEKIREYWDDLQTRNSIILYDKTKYKHLAWWEEVETERGRFWQIVSSPEVTEWLAENLKKKFRKIRVNVDPDEVPHGHYHLKKTNEWLLRHDREARNHLSRFGFVFEDDTDLIFFKMRWY